MSNSYYNGGSFPSTGSPATSASMRAELASITAGFDKLPTLSGNAEKFIRVNASGTALEPATALPSLNVNDAGFYIQDDGDATKQIRFQVSGVTTGTTRVLTVPDANFTFVGLDTTQTLTNKTLTTPVLSATGAGNTAGQLGYSAGVFTFGNGSATRTVVTLEDNQTVSGAMTFSGAASFSNTVTFTGANSFQNATGQTFLASTTTAQDGVVITGRAGGSSSYRVTIAPTTLSASRALTLPNLAGTVALTDTAQTFSGAMTFGNASGQLFLASTTTTQDGVVINGRAGGSSSYRVTIAPTTLGASRTITLPDLTGTVALTDVAQTFSGALTFGNASGQTFLASTTVAQDGVVLTGRAGGTSTYRVTISPTTLSASRAITLPDAAGTVVLDTATQSLTNKTLTSPTIASPTINDGYTEEVYSIPSSTTPALSPTNGSIQTWTLTGNSTPTAGTWAAGQSLTLLIDDGTAYTITWTSIPVTWKTNLGNAPTLNTTGLTVIQLWKVGTTIYGARVGDA